MGPRATNSKTLLHVGLITGVQESIERRNEHGTDLHSHRRPRSRTQEGVKEDPPAVGSFTKRKVFCHEVKEALQSPRRAPGQLAAMAMRTDTICSMLRTETSSLREWPP